jgi:hypothetical protein
MFMKGKLREKREKGKRKFLDSQILPTINNDFGIYIFIFKRGSK